jgi:aminopeptidase N
MFQENFDDSPHEQRMDGVRTIGRNLNVLTSTNFFRLFSLISKAHELVHQFFGNAILIDFWTHLWMIEGFTTLLEYPLAGTLYPSWRERDFFNIFTLQGVFRDDASNTQPAMTQVVETIDEIESNFGPIAYDKAGAVLRMFQNALTPELFQKALRHYVKSNNHKVVTPAEFHLAFEQVLSQDGFNGFAFTEAFKSWELQKGFPLLTARYNASTMQFHLTQQRYFADQTMRDDAASSWMIPLNVATSKEQSFDNTTVSHFFEKGSSEKVIQLQDAPGWFVFNKQQLGYYRVNYDSENWQSLINVLNGPNFNQIHVLNRAQLIDDALSLAQSKHIDFNVATEILKYLRQEIDYTPWAAAAPHLHKFVEMFGGKNQQLNVSLVA